MEARYGSHRLITALCFSAALLAQGTREDYARAERFLPTFGGAEQFTPNWIEKEDRFWYRKTSGSGTEFVMVDARTRERKPAFDHEKLAAALSLASGTQHSPRRLPFTRFELA